LCILDGWGWRDDPTDNAIAAARTPNFHALLKDYPHALLTTCGRAVGLPDGQMGNSEVGHMNIGAGRVVAQDLPRIDVAIEDGTLATRPHLLELVQKVKASKGAVHLMGLLSDGGVHSMMRHIETLAQILSKDGVPVFVHAFLDGRDTPPKSGAKYLKEFEAAIAGLAGVRLATVTGRYFAMDRDKRWDRVQKAYDVIVEAKGALFASADEAIAKSYADGVTDEFVLPVALGGYAGVSDGDALLFANFRADRAREISLALLNPKFGDFERGRVVTWSAAAGMTEYSEPLNAFMTQLFPPEDVRETIGQIVSELGMKQLRIAETEKYAHVTFFLNGGREQQFEGEDRILVPSPKVATYDQQPQMAAPEVTDKLIGAIESGKYDLIVVNYANPDMVGHTGIMGAAIEAVQTIDNSLGRLRAAVEKAGGVMLLTADHGNIELMKDPKTGEPHTAHTTFDVPVIAINAGHDFRLDNGRLADVAPTMLALMGLKQPHQMTGHSLLHPLHAEQSA
jgi:2,3-bisphosphoglycerate-independent phosphoglycerate mutase